MANVRKIIPESGGKVIVKISIVEGDEHVVTFPINAIQGLDWVYGERRLQRKLRLVRHQPPACDRYLNPGLSLNFG